MVETGIKVMLKADKTSLSWLLLSHAHEPSAMHIPLNNKRYAFAAWLMCAFTGIDGSSISKYYVPS